MPDQPDDVPPIAAVFLIKFDLKVGYTIAWKRSISEVTVDGGVEFKSLPSGLHNVKDDLVYFIQDDYAGISAFVNRPAAESERNAHLVAVGVLVPLNNSRLGRGWLHAEKLQELASAVADDTSKTAPLEKFWEQWRSDKGKQGASASKSPPGLDQRKSGHSRIRALSTLTINVPAEQSLPKFHPSLSILKCLDVFGPLIFPLYRAALLRPRILLIGSAPVRFPCEFAYDLSIISAISSTLHSSLPIESTPLYRLKPLFNVGVHDIPYLSRPRTGDANDIESELGWIACTTDEILAMKPQLYDLLIELPPITDDKPGSHPGRVRKWPKLKTSAGAEIKATRRDLRRYKALYSVLRPLLHPSSNSHLNEDGISSTAPIDQSTTSYTDDEDADTNNDHLPLLRHPNYVTKNPAAQTPAEEDSQLFSDLEKLTEPRSWTALAYSGFMWWAAAGEPDSSEEEEQRDAEDSVGELADVVGRLVDEGMIGGGRGDAEKTRGLVETTIVASFHRMTAGLVRVGAEVAGVHGERPDIGVEDGDDGEGEEAVEEELEAVDVDTEDLRRMGLDGWSPGDAEFAQRFLELYWGREVRVRTAGLECCGVKIC
ncbi:hypothetical protein P152DRAFT_461385 [Eremomyces bilateralis CBS 781.70]|uniref:DUF4484 domain-containing protein n=1 Tax=Eremomyces bilateralis CBS 781.70 TaxID=1392243 RepID=A0A6G1FUK8_9PEZI|nr:uncharacterized protein P152DRAFT_461385 [Eremomyces bilateralis CBS 781.70]KAF1809443.1 hypothetical protein P152DRAFT_461385 [Eremomyces bilateralis CBS 781.70]